jgi:hypothetical protein
MNSKNTIIKHVSFSQTTQIYYVSTDIPCIQEYLENYKECKKQFLKAMYLQKYGNMNNFNYEKELEKHNKDEKKIEQEVDKELKISED